VKFEVKSPTLVETMMQIMEIGFKAYIVYICWRLSLHCFAALIN